MFSGLKKKLQSFIGKTKKHTSKETKKEQKASKKTLKSQKKPEKTQKYLPKEKPQKEFAKKLLETPQESPEQINKIEEPQKETLEEPKKTNFFTKLSKKLNTTTLKKEHVDEIFKDLELILLENNVALEVVDKIQEDLTKNLVGIESKKDKIQETILETLNQSISSVLIEPPDLIKKIKSSLEPYTIIFFGINGSGKTTSLAKLANKLKKENISCVLGAGDTFRAASIEQLQIHADKLNLKLIKHDYGTDPAAVAFDTKKYAEKNKIQCVLIDTAGRMYTKENLIKEMEKIVKIAKPNLKLFVGESITGNDATQQARIFNDTIGIDGIILTKSDIDEKGGTALSVSYITNKPIYFLGNGQAYDDLKPFKKSEILTTLGLE